MKNKIKAIFFSVLYAIVHYSVQFVIAAIVIGIYIVPKLISDFDGNKNFNKLYKTVTENGNLNLTAILISSLISIGLYALIGKNRFGDIKEKLRFNKLSLKTVILSVVMGVGLLVLSNIVITIFTGIGLIDQNSMKELENLNSMIMGNSNSILLIISVGIVVPVAEEMLFRGIIFREVEESFSPVKTILITGIGFGVFHMLPVQIVYASVLGVIMGSVYYWTKSIYAPILLHMANNTASSVGAILTKNIDLETLSDIKKMGSTDMGNLAVLGFLSIIVFICFVSIPFIMRYFYKNRVKIESIEELEGGE